MAPAAQLSVPLEVSPDHRSPTAAKVCGNLRNPTPCWECPMWARHPVAVSPPYYTGPEQEKSGTCDHVDTGSCSGLCGAPAGVGVCCGVWFTREQVFGGEKLHTLSPQALSLTISTQPHTRTAPNKHPASHTRLRQR